MIGIYKITNKVNGKFYIGSSVTCNRRQKAHWSKLKGGYHDNRHLQNAFNKYGEKKFKFEILQELPDTCTILDIETLELYFIKMMQPQYNKTEITTRNKANSQRKIKDDDPLKKPKSQKERDYSDDYKQKMSLKSKSFYNSLSTEEKAKRNAHKNGKIFSTETRNKLSEKKKGRIVSKEERLKLSNSLKAYWANKFN